MAASYPTFDPRLLAELQRQVAQNSVGRMVNPSERKPVLPVFRDTPGGIPVYDGPRFQVDRTPEADDKLSGASGAEMAGRQYPVFGVENTAAAPTAGAAAAVAPAAAAPATNAAAPSQYEQDLRRVRDLYARPVETTGRAKGALEMLARPVEPSDSLGREIGERIGNALTGALDKRAVGRIKRGQEIAVAEGQTQADAAPDRERTASEEADAKKRLADAEIRHTDEETRQLPRQVESKMAAQEQSRLLGTLRAQGHYKRGENAALDSQLDQAGIAVSDFDKGGKFQWKEAGGQVYEMDANTGRIQVATAGDKPIEDASKKPDPKTGLTPEQAKSAAERDADRASREKVAQWHIGAQKAIAGQSQAIQRDRIRMSADQFGKRYPGAGKSLSYDAIVKKAKALHMDEKEVAGEAVRQGYTISEQ